MGTLKKKVNKYILLSPLHCRPFQVFESLKTAVHTYTPTKKEGLWKKNVHSFSKLLPDPPGTTWCTVHRRRSPHETKMTRRRKASLQRQDIPFFFFLSLLNMFCFGCFQSHQLQVTWGGLGKHSTAQTFRGLAYLQTYALVDHIARTLLVQVELACKP